MLLELDEAWEELPAEMPRLEARAWGPRLRFSALSREIEEFYRESREQLSPFLLYGSGDFHHLTALWLRRFERPLVVLSFDNHPDWDVRPPRWACGGWVNRALELKQVERVSVWGCGNFECWWPHRIFGNQRAERDGKLEVHPWADDRPAPDRKRRGAILRNNWREKFADCARGLRLPVYVTIDLDCLRPEEAVTNWENGRFTADDLCWALQEVAGTTEIIGGDICGAYSEPRFARWTQRWAAEFDHPKPQLVPEMEAKAINLETIRVLWPALLQTSGARRRVPLQP